MKLWLCEKPDQARNIAAEIGVVSTQKEYIETKDGIFTWGFGHLLEGAAPNQYDAKFARWNFEDLPCIPKKFRYEPRERARAQLKVIGSLLKKTNEVIVATDPDREGEMIVREILDHFNYGGPVRRLWLNALDSASIKRALGQIRPGASTAPLYWAAKARSEADWLERIAPTLADPGETAVWEDRLEGIAESNADPAKFVSDVGETVRLHLSGFRQSAAASSLINGASNLPAATTTGIEGVLDRGDWFEVASVRGRLYKVQWGHRFTAEEVGRLVGGESLVFTDCKSKAGAALSPKKVTFDPKGKPWPGFIFADAQNGAMGGAGAPVGSGSTGGGSDLPAPSAKNTRRKLF